VSPLSRIAALSALLAYAAPALAQGDSAAVAEKLFREGAAALKHGEVERACGLLGQSNTLDPAIGTLGLLALCHERQGRIATAVVEYRTVASLARSANQPERAQIGAARAEELAPKVSHLELSIPDHPRGMSVVVGGKLLDETDLKAPLALDPGAVVVQISAVGFESRTETALIAPDGSTTALLVPELTPLPSAQPAPAPVFAAPPTPHRAAPAANAEPAVSPATWVALGTGAAGIAVGGFFGALALSNNAQASHHCVGNECDAIGVSLRSTALHRATASTVAFAVGGVALGASVVLYVTREREAPRVTADVRATPNGGLLSLGGSF
jgi:hypothetical protein